MTKCYLSRKEYYKAKHKNNLENTLTSYHDMVRKSKKYKQELKRINAMENRNRITKLWTLKTLDSRFCWKILQGTQKKV